MAAAMINARWGDGFARQFGWMKVYEDQGVYYCDYRDTLLNIWEVARFDNVQDISGFFGFCPRAITVYQALGIPVRQTA
jgi:hypothetical protein